jgi:hypothetical protein
LNVKKTYHASIRRTTTVENIRLYLDLNSNGVRDDDEQSTRSRGDDPRTTGVDETGSFQFGPLYAGTYLVRQVVPQGHAQSQPSDGDGIGVTVALGGTAANLEFGNLAQPGTIHGIKWNDLMAMVSVMQRNRGSSVGRSTWT